MSEDERLHSRIDRQDRRVEELEKSVRELEVFRDRTGDPEKLHSRLRNLEEFKLMVRVALMTAFLLVTWVSVKGWEVLRSLLSPDR